MLEILGVPEDDEALYRLLLRERGRTPAELTERSGREPRAVRQSLQRLAEAGLVSRLAGRPVRYVATRPDTAVDALIARRHQELAAIRQAAQALLAELPADSRHRPEEELEIVFGRETVAARFHQLQQGVQRELLVLDRPPYAQNPSEPNPGEDDLLERGVRLRGIYAREALEIPGALALVRAAVEAGEEARVCEDVPLKLAIADRSAAILPFTRDRDAMVDSALVVYTSTLLDALIRLFDLLWQVAIPIFDAPDPGADGDARLLTLLAAGLKDEAIARQLGESVRTVHRRTSDLMDRLGARTRFQAGLAAARRGLIAPG